MGDGTIQKHALIIEPLNEDEGVLRSKTMLESEGFQTHSVSLENCEANESDDSSFNSQLLETIKTLRTSIDDDDELFVSVNACHNFISNDIYEEINNLIFSKRTILLHQSTTDNVANLFLDKPNTLYIAPDQEVEDQFANDFLNVFWNNQTTDLNSDGVINIQERYASAVHHTNLNLGITFATTEGYRFEGVQHFANTVVNIDSKTEMDDQLSRLTAGQTAVIVFSATWCVPCKEYEPHFKEMAESSNGQHLFLRTENDEFTSSYGIKKYPTVMIYDSDESKTELIERDLVLEKIGLFSNGYLETTDHIDELRAALHSEDVDACIQTIEHIGRTTNSIFVDDLTDLLLSSEEMSIRAAALMALEKIMPINIQKTAETVLIQDSNYKIRYACAVLLGKINNPGSREVLEQALQNDYYGVKLEAIWALGKIGNPDSIIVLEGILSQDEDYKMRIESIDAFIKINDQSSLDFIYKAALNDPNANVRVKAWKAIGHFKNFASTEILNTILSEESNSDVRTAAVLALKKIKTADSRQIIESILLSDNSEDVRSKASFSLAMMRSPESRLSLEKSLLEDQSLNVRFESARALSALNIPESRQSLEQALLNDSYDKVRFMCAVALGELNLSQSKRSLKKTLATEENMAIRSIIIEILKKLEVE